MERPRRRWRRRWANPELAAPSEAALVAAGSSARAKENSPAHQRKQDRAAQATRRAACFGCTFVGEGTDSSFASLTCPAGLTNRFSISNGQSYFADFSIFFHSSAVMRSEAAAVFSSRCATDEVPGIGSDHRRAMQQPRQRDLADVRRAASPPCRAGRRA